MKCLNYFSVGLCSVINLLNKRKEFFLTVRDPSKLAKTRSILNRRHDYTLQTKGQVLLIHWPFAAHIYDHWVGEICTSMSFNLVPIHILRI